jgi:DNA-binding NarL/FixJ family response regulator
VAAGRDRPRLITRTGVCPPILEAMSSIDPERIDLSRRQREVLGRLDEGLRARAIAARLGITETTARNHIHRLLHRLGCHSQLQAVARARRVDLL